MGVFVYSPTQQFEMDDRMLSHLQLAIAIKLRRHESFLLNFDESVQQGSGRISLWIGREIPLEFRFSRSGEPRAINGQWVEALMRPAQRTGGMFLVAEERVGAQLPA